MMADDLLMGKLLVGKVAALQGLVDKKMMTPQEFDERREQMLDSFCTNESKRPLVAEAGADSVFEVKETDPTP